MGYRIGYSGPEVDELLQKAYNFSVVNNGWAKLESALRQTRVAAAVIHYNYLQRPIRGSHNTLQGFTDIRRSIVKRHYDRYQRFHILSKPFVSLRQ